jgi:alpha-galactosidase/6-phospho-beta-glucosidase family protein
MAAMGEGRKNDRKGQKKKKKKDTRIGARGNISKTNHLRVALWIDGRNRIFAHYWNICFRCCRYVLLSKKKKKKKKEPGTGERREKKWHEKKSASRATMFEEFQYLPNANKLLELKSGEEVANFASGLFNGNPCKIHFNIPKNLIKNKMHRKDITSRAKA